MIRVLDEMPDGVLGVEAVGKLRAEDYTEVLAPALAAAIEGGGKIRIVLLFAGAFEGMEPGAVWQDLKMGIRDWSAWERIALVTDHAWMRDGLRMFAWAVPGEVKAFGSSERDDAIAWAAATLE
ncbi:STAS/SEC14 domain-containing protein [Actinoplanes sp. KI2]|uniref:STAS/SEC14 domain-containing protein n=1 Tax=Actinoplanes sp. KI2 TaxID=2983315 RepID=UPI0021D5D3BE|nr:STAS/SEC14 domain-containing protein [Actinoplanes sp. KI2]MCU7730958.1 STAS/SEC14 domain-containing protein [Actinoplanes sp. KI2]